MNELGYYPTTPDEALKLGAIHFNYKFGDYNDTIHKPGFFGARIVEFIPVKHLRTKPLDQWELSFIEAIKERDTMINNGGMFRESAFSASFHDNLNNENFDLGRSRSSTLAMVEENPSNSNPQRQYMNIMYKMLYYGCTFFPCKMSVLINTTTTRTIPQDPILAIHPLGTITMT
jgi:hypothetical protein